MDTKTSETPTLTLNQENENERITSTDANTQDDQTSHSNISNSWTTGTLTGTQKSEPTTETSTNREQTAFSESTITAISSTTTPDSSSSIFTSSSEPNHFTIRSTTKIYSTIQATTQLMNTSVSPINYQSTATQTMDTLTNATSHGISSTESATTTSTDTSMTLTTTTTTGSSFPSPDASSGTSHSAATTTQQLESSDHTQVSITSNESTTTTIAPTSTPDLSSDIFTTSSEPNHFTTRGATESYPAIQATTQTMNTALSDTSDSPSIYQSTNELETTSFSHLQTQMSQTISAASALQSTSSQITPTNANITWPSVTTSTSSSRSVTNQTAFSESTKTTSMDTKTSETPTLTLNQENENENTTTTGIVSRPAITPDSMPTSMNTPSKSLTTQENLKKNTNTSLNPFSPASPVTAISNDSKPVTTPLAEEHKGTTVGISIQTALNRSDSEGTTVTDTWSNSISSIPAGLTNPQLSRNTSRDGKADDSANSVKRTIVFVFNIPKVPVFKTITFSHSLVNQVTVMNTVLRP
ncbi:hypothetical protein G5714_008746 [Onychostoma macrolepis]|uniref:Uncharacterized protein n=1 Tax=Onychostoma macrolepis TaxID=369639 RepID=A0A7J6CYD3_9TELE|nr:hypothetical protein G5714_008746 [Onychostoma macrolepis]